MSRPASQADSDAYLYNLSLPLRNKQVYILSLPLPDKQAKCKQVQDGSQGRQCTKQGACSKTLPIQGTW